MTPLLRAMPCLGEKVVGKSEPWSSVIISSVQAAITTTPGNGWLKQQALFLSIREAGKYEVREPSSWFTPCAHTVEGGRDCFLGSVL